VERSILAFFKSNLQLTLLNGPFLFFGCLVPFLLFFAFAEVFHPVTPGGIAYFIGPVLTAGIVGNGLWGAGVYAADATEGSLRESMAGMATGWLLYLPVAGGTLALAHGLYGMNPPRDWVSLVAVASLGLCAVRAIGLVLTAVGGSRMGAAIALPALYLPMLYVSGVTVPAAQLPEWAQTAGEFLPAAYLVKGFQGILYLNRDWWDNRVAGAAFLLTILVGLVVARRIFRREEEDEEPAASNKAWALAVLVPFVAMGCWRASGKEHIEQNRAMLRLWERSGVFLIRNTRIFTGEGPAIENGSVLVRDGKIAAIYTAAAPDPETLHADVVEGAGKTLLPGLIDVHVHLGGPAGLSDSTADYDLNNIMPRADAELLYCGVTGARSVGDELERSLALRRRVDEGAGLGAHVFVCGPMFAAANGRGTEFTRYVPEAMRSVVQAELVRTPKTADAARAEVRELKRRGADGIKAILEAGWGEGMLDDRLDLFLVRAIAGEAHAQNLPLAVHTGNALDVFDAVDVGAASVEHGSWRDELPDSLLERMAREQVYLDPTLAVAEAYAQYFSGRSDALAGALVQEAVPERIRRATREMVASGKSADPARAEIFNHALEVARANLLRAWQAGVPLAMGTDAGNPLVFHGPSLHHELQLWVQAGIPPAVALQAATANAAKLVGGSGHIGAIRQGFDANLLLVEGNPLEDISATERISLVVMEGKRVRRGELLGGE
jgi:imidazolonepropionase-like amidohydrolase